MKIIQDFPPNIEQIKKVFKLRKNCVFTWEDIIYNPDNGLIDPFLMKHESTHSLQQQEIGVKKWWDRYLKDKDFRLSQEVPAYQSQAMEARKYIKNRNILFKFFILLAKDLSGETYGNMITFQQAYQAIKTERPIVFKV